MSFPPYGFGTMAWIALVPLLIALQRGTLKESVIIGFLAGFVGSVGLIYWITYVTVIYGKQSWLTGLAAMLILAAYLSVYVALFAGGVSYLKERGVPQVITAPLLWTCLEYLKSNLLTGFPWENLAYSQYLNTPLIQIADITGIYGISFMLVFINAVICDSLRGLALGFQKQTNKTLAVEMMIAFLLLFGLLAYGQLRIQEMRNKLTAAPSIDVALIQGNIDQSLKWDRLYQQRTLATYNSLSKQALPCGSGLVIWPETALPFYFQDGDLKSRQVVRTARETGKWLIFGSPSYRNKPGGADFFNSAFLLSPEGQVVGRYDKVHLVPYGEYVPYRGSSPSIGKLVAGEADFHAGEGYFPISLSEHKMGVLICYEGIFPEASRLYKQRGAELLVNITNDAWFGFSSAPYQHLSMTVFRAVENRLYLLRAANTGISAIIDPVGRIISQSALHVTTILPGKARFIDSQTFYMAYGDLFTFLCFLSLLFLYINCHRRTENE